MELDEVIKRYQEKAIDLEVELYDTLISLGGPKHIEEEIADYLEYVAELRQLAEWLTELKRLQSMGSHCDGYETEGYVFSYYESGEVIRITIYNTKSPDHYYADEVEIFKALSHDEFVEWCNDYLSKENK